MGYLERAPSKSKDPEARQDGFRGLIVCSLQWRVSINISAMLPERSVPGHLHDRRSSPGGRMAPEGKSGRSQENDDERFESVLTSMSTHTISNGSLERNL